MATPAKVLESSRFEVVSTLGQGGMGTVYEAVDHERHLRVALKMLHRLEPKALLRFKGEFRKLQDLHHPNLVSLGELVEEQGQWFFTMEFVQGCDFLAYIQKHTLPREDEQGPTLRVPAPAADPLTAPTVALGPGMMAMAAAQAPVSAPAVFHSFDADRLRNALGQLALGLHALHRAGKVHRDIKPSNILVTPEGRVVLLDFGILSDVEDDETWDGSVVVGTANYMAPEQARGKPPTPRADWYSVGVMLHLCLTGSRPRATSVLLEWPPGLPEDLCQLCERLLRPEPHLRPTGEEVLRWLGLEQVAREEAWATAVLPFVGRAAELRELSQAMEDCRQGGSVVLRVEGDSGVGKSRLVRHFLHEVARQAPRAVVLTGRCYERESVPYKGVDGLVDGLVRYLQGLGQGLASVVVTEELSALGRLFPIVQALNSSGSGALEPSTPVLQLRLAAFASLRRLFERLALLRQVVLWVDDLQWAGSDTVALLEELLQAPGLLLVATMRRCAAGPLPELARERRWWTSSRVLSLEGLPREDAQRLVDTLLGRRSSQASEAALRIARESEGHPLFIDALVRYQELAQPGDQPARLDDALWARVRRLEPAARVLLEVLAVSTGMLPHEVVAQTATLGPVEYSRLIASLRGAHLVVTTGPADTDRVEVLHDRVRQAVAGHLSLEQRQQWHGRLAGALEERRQGRAETLALHWREAGERERAAGYSVQAASEAEQALAFSHAADLYQQAIELGAWQPAEQLRLRLTWAEALANAGRGRESAEAFLAAIPLASEDEARGLRRRAAEQYLFTGYVDEGLATVSQTLAELGLRLPRSNVSARALTRWQRMRLAASLQERPWPRQAHCAPEPYRTRLEVLHFLSSGLQFLSPTYAMLFVTIYQREALEAGDSLHLCQGRGVELLHMAAHNPRAGEELRQLEEQVLQLAALHPEVPTLQAAVSLRLTFKAMITGHLEQIRPLFERTLSLLQGQKGGHWMLAGAWAMAGHMLGAAGELNEMHKLFALPTAEAWQRGDLLSLCSLELGPCSLRWLARDDPQLARQNADAVIGRLSQRGFFIPHANHLASMMLADLYEGQAEQAISRERELWPRVDAMQAAQAMRGRLLDLGARARLMRAMNQDGPGLEPLLAEVLAEVRLLDHLGLDVALAKADLVRAGVAAARGQPEAGAMYGQAAARLERFGMLLAAQAARVRQGQWLGAEQGRGQVEASLAWMRERGIHKPERMAHLFAPWGPAAERWGGLK